LQNTLGWEINLFVPSIPKNGTPTLMANYKIIQALIGYTTISAYATLSMLPTTINLLHASG